MTAPPWSSEVREEAERLIAACESGVEPSEERLCTTEAPALLASALAEIRRLSGPRAGRLPCPSCHALHIDEGVFVTKPHHTHACQECGEVWRPFVEPTVGVRYLPGFKNGEPCSSPLEAATEALKNAEAALLRDDHGEESLETDCGGCDALALIRAAREKVCL